VALEPAVTLGLAFAEVERLRSAHPAVDRQLVEMLAQRVARLSDHLLEALHVPADERIVRRLSEICNRYAAPEGAHSVVVPLTQDAIADLAGASRPTTNRVLRRLEENGILALRRGAIEVLDRTALAGRASR
jgi:CRP-like cAMP-binding protein